MKYCFQMLVSFLQDPEKRKAIDAAREDARLLRIATELADEEERKRQWRVARGEVCTFDPNLEIFACPIFGHSAAHVLFQAQLAAVDVCCKEA